MGAGGRGLALRIFNNIFKRLLRGSNRGSNLQPTAAALKMSKSYFLYPYGAQLTYANDRCCITSYSCEPGGSL